MLGGRGQMSMEMLIGIAFVLFILLLSSIYAAQKSAEGNDLKIKTDGARVCQSFADNVNNIAEQGNGFYKYFSLPEKIYGDNEYTLAVYNNWVEITVDNYTWTTQMVTSNISIICLDKDLTKKNKVFNELERIYLICNKPELRVVNASLRPTSIQPGGEVNISFQVMNFGPVDAGQFDVILNFNNTPQTQTISSLKSEEKTYLTYNVISPADLGYYTFNITLDPADAVNESIEENNFNNETIRIV